MPFSIVKNKNLDLTWISPQNKCGCKNENKKEVCKGSV